MHSIITQKTPPKAGPFAASRTTKLDLAFFESYDKCRNYHEDASQYDGTPWITCLVRREPCIGQTRGGYNDRREREVCRRQTVGTSHDRAGIRRRLGQIRLAGECPGLAALKQIVLVEVSRVSRNASRQASTLVVGDADVA